MTDDGVNSEKRSISVPACLTAGMLVCSLLLGTLQWVGAPAHGGMQTRQSGEKLASFVEQRLSDARRGLNGLERIYWIDPHALSAPTPNPANYSRIDSPEHLAAVEEAAQSLLDGQTLFFSGDITPLPGTAVRCYLDKTILAITWKQAIDGGVYTFSEIKIAHPSQFRRFLAGGEFGSEKLFVTTEMAQSVNAVVASSGDFYNYRQAGTLVYDGLVRRVNNGLVDTCYVDKNGDLVFSSREDDRSREEFQQFVEEENILFSLAFGPVLIRQGQVVTPERYAVGEIHDHYPRSALCQLGKLHYLLAVVNSEGDYQQTPTLRRFGEVLQDRGVQTAYTLDGGQTAVIAMDGELINAVLFGYQRKISDIIYFATAIPAGQNEETDI